MEISCPLCIICRRECNQYDGKAWIEMKNDRYFDTHLSIIHYCGYLCFERNRHLLPKDHWKNVLNKEDFNCPLPVLPLKGKSFEYLTYNEYIELNDAEKKDYDSQKEKNELMNPNYNSFHIEQYEEDKRVYELETSTNIESDESFDDY